MKTAKKPTEICMGNPDYGVLEDDIERLNHKLLNSNKKSQKKLERNLKKATAKDNKSIAKRNKVISKILKK